MKLKIYTDGASRGNPGPGAIAFVIFDQRGKILKQHKEFIGICTNNIAEYRALIAGMKEAAKIGKEIACFSDSRLTISQMKGEYKVKKSHIKELFEQAKSLEKKFKKVTYSNVLRTDPNIKKADRMVNEVLDKIC